MTTRAVSDKVVSSPGGYTSQQLVNYDPVRYLRCAIARTVARADPPPPARRPTSPSSGTSGPLKRRLLQPLRIPLHLSHDIHFAFALSPRRRRRPRYPSSCRSWDWLPANGSLFSFAFLSFPLIIPVFLGPAYRAARVSEEKARTARRAPSTRAATAERSGAPLGAESRDTLYARVSVGKQLEIACESQSSFAIS